MSELAQFKEDLKRRIKLFAHRCVKLALSLPPDQLGNHIRGQLIRASTSSAANYRASCNALSIPLIISKMSISIEETDESEFWIEFSQDENLIANSTEAVALRKEAHEIILILTKARQTLQNKK
jgi:four helix bundle protein